MSPMTTCAAVTGIGELGQHDDRPRLHGPALVHELVGTGERLELRRGVGDGGVGRPVEHEPHRALVGVLRHEHDRALEVRVEKGGRRDEQRSAQGVHRTG